MTARSDVLVRVVIAGLAALALAIGGWRFSRMQPAPAPVASPPASAANTEGPRIVALSPAIAVILRDLGLEQRIVGRHGWDIVLPKSIPVCGDQVSGADYEALLRVRPTHILMQSGARDTPARLRSLADEHGWRLQQFNPLSLDEVVRTTTDLAAEFIDDPTLLPAGEGEAARRAWDGIRARMQEVWAPGRPDIGAGRILLLESMDPPGALGPGSFHQQILERIGGTAAMRDGKPYLTLDAEDVLRLAPDGIIIFAPREGGTPPGPPATAEQLRTRMGRIGRLDIPAMKNGHIAVIDDPVCKTPSTGMLGVSEEMERILRQWAGK